MSVTKDDVLNSLAKIQTPKGVPLPAATVLAESPAFAPQVTKVLGAPWLTVTEVRRALRPVPGGVS